MCCGRTQLWSQAGLVCILALPLGSHIILDQTLEPQSLYLRNRDTDIYENLACEDPHEIMCFRHLRLHNQ